MEQARRGGSLFQRTGKTKKKCDNRFALFVTLISVFTPVSVLASCDSTNARTSFYPCRCSEGDHQSISSSPPDGVRVGTLLDCDGAAFPPSYSFPSSLPEDLRSLSIRGAGIQILPSAPLLRSRGLLHLDLSDNLILRLPEKLLEGAEDSLESLRLGGNLLGDHLNPVFSCPQLRRLQRLRTLDLSGNALKDLEAGLFEGCEQLKELILSKNSLLEIPSAALNGPRALKSIALDGNRIGRVQGSAFLSQRLLEAINLSDNALQSIESGAFAGLTRLRRAIFNRNSIKVLDSDTFKGAENLEQLDLSENSMTEVPSVALDSLLYLKTLNLSSNSIQIVRNKDLQKHSSLETLDLSRNAISSLGPGTFLGLRSLRTLDLGVNALRAVEDDAFEGLSSLSFLSLRDNNALIVPSSALGRLPRLAHLRLDFNRVAAVSQHLLPDLAPSLRSLDLSHNVVRELPNDAFRRFSSLSRLSLSGNRLATLEEGALSGLENNLEHLHLDGNRLRRLPILRLPRLLSLSLGSNRLSSLPDLSTLSRLEQLSLSDNPEAFLRIPSFALPNTLRSLDLSAAGIRSLPNSFLPPSLATLDLSLNLLSRLESGSFRTLTSLLSLFLSFNSLSEISDGAFVGLDSLRNLSLAHNQLSRFSETHFGNGSALEELDLSDNRITLLTPFCLRPHSRLRMFRASNNRISSLPRSFFAHIPSLRFVDLSGNRIRAIGAALFAHLPSLSTLLLRDNRIEVVDESSFANSSQIRIVDASDNALGRLGERTFEGISALKLNLSRNRLSSLPDGIFDRSRVGALHEVDLSGNGFDSVPLDALGKQSASLMRLSLSANLLTEVPRSDLLVKIKSLDVSSNSLTPSTHRHMLSDPKTVRELNLSDAGLENLPSLETPFLRVLDLSRNRLSEIPLGAFDRTTSLERLDLSDNLLPTVGESLRRSWKALHFLERLDMSGNPITDLKMEDFSALVGLVEMKISRMPQLRTLALATLPRLRALSLHSLPVLGYLDARELIDRLPPTIEALDIEPSESTLDERPARALRHRIRSVTFRGGRLRNLSPGALAGLVAPEMEIRLADTELTSIPPTIFFPLPKSSKISLDVSGAKMRSLAPSLIAAFDSRRDTLRVTGIEGNPIDCGCEARSLRRWLLTHPKGATNVPCSTPSSLSGRFLPDGVSDEDLGCDSGEEESKGVGIGGFLRPAPSNASSIVPETTAAVPQASSEPEIIWSLPPPPPQTPKGKDDKATKNASSSRPAGAATNDDTLVVGVVGGVVLFVALLATGICVARIRFSGGGRYRGGPLAAEGGGSRRQSSRGAPGLECGCTLPRSPPKIPLPAMYSTMPAPYMVPIERW